MEIGILLLDFRELPFDAPLSQKFKFLINDGETCQCTIGTRFGDSVESQFFEP